MRHNVLFKTFLQARRPPNKPSGSSPGVPTLSQWVPAYQLFAAFTLAPALATMPLVRPPVEKATTPRKGNRAKGKHTRPEKTLAPREGTHAKPATHTHPRASQTHSGHVCLF